MSDRGTQESVVSRLYEARNQSNVDAVMELLHPDGSFRIAGTTRLGSFTQRADGHQAIRAAADALVENWDLSGVQNVSIHADGDTVFVHRAGKITFIPTGKTIDTEFIDKLRFEDGLIIDYVQFVDTYQVAHTAGLLKE